MKKQITKKRAGEVLDLMSKVDKDNAESIALTLTAIKELTEVIAAAQKELAKQFLAVAEKDQVIIDKSTGFKVYAGTTCVTDWDNNAVYNTMSSYGVEGYFPEVVKVQENRMKAILPEDCYNEIHETAKKVTESDPKTRVLKMSREDFLED